jgi:hypothetical protein
VVQLDAVHHRSGIEVLPAGFERGSGDGRTDQDVELLQDGTQSGVDAALDLQTAWVVPRRDPRGVLCEPDRVRREQCAMVVDLTLDQRTEHRAEVDERGLDDLASLPWQVDLLHDRSRLAEDVRGGSRVRLDVVVDLEVAEGHGQRDLPALDPLEGRPDVDLRPERRDVADVGARHHVVEQCAVGNGARHRTLVAPVIEVVRRLDRHSTVRGLEADNAAAGRRDADRTSDVGPGGQRGRARREGSCRAAGRSARAELEIPRVAGDAPQPRVREPCARELGSGRACMDDRAGVDHALRYGRAVVCDVVRVDERPLGRALALDRCLFLDGDRDALERPQVPVALRVPVLRPLGRGQRFLEEANAERIDRWLDQFGAGDQRLHELHR